MIFEWLVNVFGLKQEREQQSIKIECDVLVLPVDSEDYTSSNEVWMICSEQLSDVSVDLQRPRSVMSSAIQFIRLNIKSL